MALNIRWQVHSVLPRSVTNGPGTRFTVSCQGCTLACPGCFTPETHRNGGGRAWTVDAVVDAVVEQAADVDGVTLTGGEPLEQPAAVAAFCAGVKSRTGLGIIVLTGYAKREIEADPLKAAAVSAADMVIAGRYNAWRHLGTGLRGSANKEYWARTARYAPADFA